MEEKELKHLECTVTEEGAVEFISIFTQDEGDNGFISKFVPNEEDDGYVDAEDNEYFEVECSSIVGDVAEPVFYIIRNNTEFKNHALEVLRKSEYVKCNVSYAYVEKEITLKIQNNFTINTGSGYTVEIEHNLKVDSKECKKIEDICIQYQLNIE